MTEEREEIEAKGICFECGTDHTKADQLSKCTVPWHPGCFKRRASYGTVKFTSPSVPVKDSK